MTSEDDIYESIMTNTTLPYQQSPAKTTTNMPNSTVDGTVSDEICLVLYNLYWWTSDEDLRKFFGTRGAHLSLLLRSIRFAEDKRSSRSMGVVVMTFVKKTHSMAALDLINAFGEVDDLGPRTVIGEDGSVIKRGMDAKVMSVEQAGEECTSCVIFKLVFLVLLLSLLVVKKHTVMDRQVTRVSSHQMAFPMPFMLPGMPPKLDHSQRGRGREVREGSRDSDRRRHSRDRERDGHRSSRHESVRDGHQSGRRKRSRSPHERRSTSRRDDRESTRKEKRH
jgi:hypothetical protein